MKLETGADMDLSIAASKSKTTLVQRSFILKREPVLSLVFESDEGKFFLVR